MSILGDIVKVAWPLLLRAAQGIADSQVDGATISPAQKKIIYAAYVVIKTHGVDLVDSTDNPYDNAALDALAEFAADTLLEGGINVPIIPDFGDDIVPNVVSGDIPDA